MRAIPTSLKSSSRSCTSISAALLLAFTVCFSGTAAIAQVPASGDVVINQSTQLGTLPSSGGAQSGSSPAGDSMAVNSAGNLIVGNTYGGDVAMYTPQGVQTVIGMPSSSGNAAGVAVDAQNNLFVAQGYGTNLLKVPYVNGAYVPLTASPTSTFTAPNCTGTDTAECTVSSVTNVGADIVSMVFDAKGDLFFTTGNTNDGGASDQNSIFECTAACLYGTGSPAPVLLFTETQTTSILTLGGIALDAAGDIFFTDSAISSTSNETSLSSDLEELPVLSTATSGYVVAPTVIYTYTPTSSAEYGAEIDGVAVAANGTVYAIIQALAGGQAGPAAGIFGFPLVSGAYSSSTMYLVSTQSGKLMTSDALGNLYIADNSNNLYEIALNNVTATPSTSNVASTTNLTVILNDGDCTSNSSVTFALAGATPSVFAVAPTGACTATSTGDASYATTLTFTPTAVGTASATLAATDTLNNSATATVSGNGTGTVATPAFSVPAGTYTSTQTVSITDATVGASIYYTTDGTIPGANTGTSTLYSGSVTVSGPETINAIAVDSGDTSSAVATAMYVINLPGGAATPIFSPAGGAFTTPQAVTITDATAGAMIYYTTDGSTPTASSTLYTSPIAVSTTETVNAIAVASGVTNSAVGSELFTITLPASAFQDIVMSQSTSLGALPSSGGAQSGAAPAGDTMAVNSAGNLIVGDTYGGNITMYTPQGTQTILGMPQGSGGNVAGVAVDAQNNLFIGLGYNATLLKVPYVNGTYATITSIGSSTPPACTGNDTTECVVSSVDALGTDVMSLVFDAKGDLFYSTANSASGGNDLNAIFECTAACLYATGGSPAPVLLFQELITTSPNTLGQLSIGGLALDASGDIFFTDSAIGVTNNEESFSSNLNELPVSSSTSTGYAATQTVIYTHTPATPGNYDDEVDGVAVGPNGTVYALVQNVDGILALPNTSTGYSSSTVYLVSSQSGKLMTSDMLGNLYIADNSNNLYQIAVDNLMAPTSPEQNAATATNITTFLNDGGCTATPPTVTFAASGTSASAFSAATTGACTGTAIDSLLTGASFATTLTFTPTSVGSNSATLTATDSLSNTGTATVSGQGTPAPPAATPTFSVPTGSYTTVQTVAIADTTPNASIYYTTDGSTPVAGTSMLYTVPINITTTETINAIATATGFTSSPVATALYTVTLPVAATPSFSVAAGTYTTPQTVSITDSTPSVTIWYTIDGSLPGPGTGTSVQYTVPITVGVTEILNAIAAPSSPTVSFASSAVASALYTINLPVVATPAFSVAAGTFTNVQTVSLSDATAGAAIYYTTDGSTPGMGTGTSTLYSTPITVAVSTTIKAIAVDANYNNSAIATAAYVINLPATAFTITAPAATALTVVGGTGSITLTVTANAAFNGSISFACSGFLPIGATCAFSPVNVTLAALANSTTKLTVTVPKTTAALHRGPNSLLSGTMAAAMLCLLGFRKRRRLRMLLMLVVSVAGLSMFSGCTTTSSSSTTSSQMVVTATGSSLPVDAPANTQPTPVSASIPLVLTIQ